MLQAWSEAQLRQDLGFQPDVAASLWAWCRGQCEEEVAEKGPPKTLSVQISLTPVPLAMHPSAGAQVSAAGGKAGAPTCPSRLEIAFCALISAGDEARWLHLEQLHQSSCSYMSSSASVRGIYGRHVAQVRNSRIIPAVLGAVHSALQHGRDVPRAHRRC